MSVEHKNYQFVVTALAAISLLIAVPLSAQNTGDAQTTLPLPAKDDSFDHVLSQIPPPKDSETALGFYQDCQSGDSSSCVSLGNMYIESIRVLKHATKAVTDAQKTCDAGKALGCSMITLRPDEDQGLTQYRSFALALFQKVCDVGDGQGCKSLGDLYSGYGASSLLGTGNVEDDVKAVDLYRQACESDGVVGCGALARMYLLGRGVKKDGAKAVALLRKTCDANDHNGCLNLGLQYRKGIGIDKDPKKAVALFSKLCDEDYAGGCAFLAVMYRKGQGVEKDEIKAAMLGQKACDLGDTLRCKN